MQFTTPTQQLTTCPQCDNVVRIDAEICNICGKRLRPASPSAYLSATQQEEEEEEYEDEDEDEDYLDEDDEPGPGTTALAAQYTTRQPGSLPPSPSEILGNLRRLQEK